MGGGLSSVCVPTWRSMYRQRLASGEGARPVCHREAVASAEPARLWLKGAVINLDARRLCVVSTTMKVLGTVLGHNGVSKLTSALYISYDAKKRRVRTWKGVSDHTNKALCPFPWLGLLALAFLWFNLLAPLWSDGSC